MAQTHTKSNGRRPGLLRPRSLNAAIEEAVEAQQQRARAPRAQAQETEQRIAPRPAAERIIEKLAAIERHVGILPANTNFQGAEQRIRTNARDEQTMGAEPRWAMQTQLAHDTISAIGARLGALEDRLEVVLAPVMPTPDRPDDRTTPSAHLPVTRLQAQQAEIIGRLHATVEQLDGLLARINL